ncbi:hypothetical protein ABE438_01280 [Bosea sp. TWI1241]|uniref:hypothetical protein n=1 Tax=Bosea sp. TWI1241 TaxID=3148904 RepID=UPI00320B7536
MTDQTTLTLSLFADYFQFYLQDESANEDFGQLWTEEAVGRLLAVAESSVGIGTARNRDVPVAVSVHADEPEDDFGEWDLVNECSFTVRSGRVAILGCTDYLPDAVRIALPPGSYRLRASYAGLATVSDDGMEGDDFYRLQLWPAPPAPVRTLKAGVAVLR